MTELRLPSGFLLKEKYRITRMLGEGGMGVVYEATDETLGRRVAIKVLQSAIATDAMTRQRFDNEAKALARIESEHIVTVYERFELTLAKGGSPSKFMAMEFLEGEDLDEVVFRRGRVATHEAVGYVLEAMLAIAQAHALGIVHRDLKPANFFLATLAEGRQRVKVLDFGISKMKDEGGRGMFTSDSSVLGSPAYMAPEQLRRSNGVDARRHLVARSDPLSARHRELALRRRDDGRTVREYRGRSAAASDREDPERPRARSLEVLGEGAARSLCERGGAGERDPVVRPTKCERDGYPHHDGLVEAAPARLVGRRRHHHRTAAAEYGQACTYGGESAAHVGAADRGAGSDLV